MKLSQRTYNQSQVVSFSNTKGLYGGLSNMSPGYSLFVNEIVIPNSEALYQACRFPLFPDIQEKIIAQKSPMDSKKISYSYLDRTRQDWDIVKFDIMRWCLMVKLIQNWDSFGNLLKSTGLNPIVEYSKKDKVWAATPEDGGKLVGVNALGRILMDIREKYVLNDAKPLCVKPLSIPGFNLYNFPITSVYEPSFSINDFDNYFTMEV